jgi:hypothetical protein
MYAALLFDLCAAILGWLYLLLFSPKKAASAVHLLIFNWFLVFLCGIPAFRSSMIALFSPQKMSFTHGGMVVADWLLRDRNPRLYT